MNIPYTAAHYACFAQKADQKTGNAVEAWAGVTAISLTNFTIRTLQWGYFYESQSDTDYRHFPVAFTTFLLPVLGKAYYLTTEPDGYVPYIEYLGSNNFLCGFGNNRIGNAYVPIMVIGM